MENSVKTKHRFLTDIWTASCQYPLSVSNGKDTTYVCWQEYARGHDVIVAGLLGDQGVQNSMVLSGEGEALKPAAVFHNGAFHVVWSEAQSGQWSLCLRVLRDSVWEPVRTIARGLALFYPAVGLLDNQLAVLWCEQDKRSSQVMLWVDTPGTVDTPTEKNPEAQVLSVSPEVYRPSMATDSQGNVYVVYDRFNGTNYDVVARVRMQGTWQDEVVLTATDDRWAACPLVVPANAGVVLGWYDFGPQAAFAFKSSHLSMEQGKLKMSEPYVLASAVDWYQDISLASNGDSVVFAYTWGKNNVHVRHSPATGQWSDPVIMSLDDTNCAVHPHVRFDSDNVVHLAWQFALKNGHQQHRNAQIIYSTLALEDFPSQARADAEQTQTAFTLPIPTPKQLLAPPDDVSQQWLERNGFTTLKAVFGDIHGQSGISDGMGEIDQYFHYARMKANLEFTALTDHDCYPDWMSQSEWEWIRTTSNLFNVDGDLTTLLSYEWTPNEYRYDFGHKNVYYRGNEGEIFRSCDEGGMTADRLFASVKSFGAMAFAHHPAATWTMVSAATDWAFHDDSVQRLVEIYSRHAPFEYYGNTSVYTKNNPQLRHCSVQDALQLGYHMGFTAGSDSHQMEHGVEGGIIGMLVPQLNRDAVFDALYQRTCWATTGARMLISFKLNAQNMGSVVPLATGERFDLTASVLGTDDFLVELLHGPEVVHSQRSTAKTCDFTFHDTAGEQESWYYLRVTQDDKHQGWSSPIWV